jgi:peptidoglycan hydrolase-like protein with peptidoglycan-binding domain
MGVVTARLAFLAFLGLTGTIIYNALYLQEHMPKPATGVDAPAREVVEETQTIEIAPPDDVAVPPARQVGQSPAAVAITSVSTDLPPLPPKMAESQLVVRAVQRELAARGYDVGPVDGNITEKARTAIAAFQTSEGLAVTGLPSDELLRQILLGDSIAPAAARSLAAPNSIAAKAAEHETVQKVQQTLAELGYAPGPIDGAWGENTSRAISAFQRDRNLPRTGQITQELLEEFQRVTGRDFTKTAAHR